MALSDGVLPPDHEYCEAVKQIKTMADFSKWEGSEAYEEYLGFLTVIGTSIKGKKISTVNLSKTSPAVNRILDLLETLSSWINEFPPENIDTRFGNKSYRKWAYKLSQETQSLMENLLDPDLHKSIVELGPYLKDSFGNAIRIDYGTGHEMAFVFLLACLFKVGSFKVNLDEEAVGLVVFDKYLKLVRKLQTVYRMEPAGSQGVWALDDYQFVPFIWGSAQLIGDPRIEPRWIPDKEKADALSSDYIFFSCIKYIFETKTGPFAEHSNQLWNVSAVPSWDKVNFGLTKMYKAEVLSKFPVIQHTLFGSILSLKPAIKADSRLKRPQGSMLPPKLVPNPLL